MADVIGTVIRRKFSPKRVILEDADARSALI
jgi:hypothetical protein